MRQAGLFIAMCAFAAVAGAQERTVFGGPVETGTFFGGAVKFTAVNDQAAVLVGGRGGLVINHSLLIGGGGYGIVSEVDAPEGAPADEGPLDLEFGYGGLELEYRIRPQSLAHIGLSTLVGGGVANYVKEGSTHTREDTRVIRRRERVGERDIVFVVEPGVNAEINMTRWFHVNAGVTYRLVRGIAQERLTNREFTGVAGTVNFKFGKF